MSAGQTALVTVYNVPPTATWEQLYKFVAKYASVVNVEFVGNAGDGGKISILETRTHNDAQLLVRKLNGRQMETRVLRLVLNHADTYKIPDTVASELSTVFKVICPKEVADALRDHALSCLIPRIRQTSPD